MGLWSRYGHLISNIETTCYSIFAAYKGIRILAVYFPPSLLEKEIESILSSYDYDILIGDVNVRYGSITDDYVKNFPKRREAIASSISRLNLSLIRAASGRSRTDHVYSIPNLVQHWIYKQVSGIYSDHLLMEIILKLPDTVDSSDIGFTERFKIKCLKELGVEHIFRQKVSDSLKRLEWNQSASIDDWYLAFSEVLTAACKRYLGTYKPVVARSQPDSFYAEMNTAACDANISTRLFKRAQRTAKSGISIHGRNGLTPMDDVVHQFQSTFSAPPHDQLFDIDSNASFECQGDLLLTFSAENISTFFKSYCDTKACGLDGFHTVILRTLCQEESFLLALARIYQRCVMLGKTPADWNSSVTFPLAKSKDSKFISDFRPVALTSMLRRCFESLFLRYIECSPLNRFFALNFAQAGFQKNQSSLQQILAADDFQCSNRGLQVFIDLKSAYDRVNLNRLWLKLRLRHSPEYLIQLFKSLFNGCSTQVAVNGVLSPSIQLHTGLFQGSIISPFLWSIYVDDLADSLNGVVPCAHPKALFYADDIRLQYSRKHALNLIQLDLQVIDQWAAVNNMIVSTTKSAVISALPQVALSINGSHLPLVKTYKYLGIEFDQTGIAWNAYLDRCQQRAASTLQFCKALSDDWRPSIRVTIAKTFILPLLEYGFPLLYAFLEFLSRGTSSQKKQAEDIKDLLGKEIKNVTMWCLKKEKFMSFMPSICGISTLDMRLKQLGSSFTNNLRRAPEFSPISRIIHSLHAVSPLRRIAKYLTKTTLTDAFDRSEDGTSFKSFIKTWRIKIFVENFGPVAKYITKKGRTQSGMDKALDIRNREIIRWAVRWRTNSMIRNCFCRCGATFTRRHVMCTRFKDVEQLQSKVEKARTRLNLEFYSVLDELLNQGRFQEFRERLEELGELQ